ncbi:SprT family zinc-dependent metalloprotease [Caloramator sp. CAR-1]|uniref:M48 family metallopeptidase n=1 Tax=Caloramator sp. CAR-1 TaxID=3062777 RepID=UPI0026E16E48|nr:SprT family zinc-dependent metalloprotease [Caloramator sp. CAR-1]MDO6354612.1 SprT family zinc-dependent metalloprotease [Caloramator sp. CAR-1]
MPHIIYNGQRIDYKVSKKGKKMITIRVNEKGEVIVTAPPFADDDFIRMFVEKGANLILEKLKELGKNKKDEKKKEFTTGKRLPFLGSELTLKVIVDDVDKIRAYKKDCELIVCVPKLLDKTERQQHINDIIIKWYKEQAKKIFKIRLDYYSRKYGFEYKRMAVKEQRTRWGSCSTKGNINLNWRLLFAPIDVIDHVIIHELCHLKHHNHSKSFWNEIKSIDPDYESKKKWLKENEKLIFSII